MKDIVLELTTAEALLALGAIQDKQLDASTLAAISSGEEHEIADLSSKMLGRIAQMIVDALYPKPTIADVERVAEWFDRHEGFEDDFDREGDPAFNGAFKSW